MRILISSILYDSDYFRIEKDIRQVRIPKHFVELGYNWAHHDFESINYSYDADELETLTVEVFMLFVKKGKRKRCRFFKTLEDLLIVLNKDYRLYIPESEIEQCMRISASGLKNNNDMKTENYISYEQSVKLKELGYDEPCNAFYAVEPNGVPDLYVSPIDCVNREVSGRDVAAPHVWDVLRWLREEHDLHIEPDFVYKGNYDTYVKSSKRNIYRPIPARFKSYDDAIAAGLDAALGMLTKEKGNETE
ncbi:MAG: hypothetical protein K1W14_06460 [Muribaculaceae bacterium]